MDLGTERRERTHVRVETAPGKSITYEYCLVVSNGVPGGYREIRVSKRVLENGEIQDHVVRTLGGSGHLGLHIESLFRLISNDAIALDPIHLQDVVRDQAIAGQFPALPEGIRLLGEGSSGSMRGEHIS